MDQAGHIKKTFPKQRKVAPTQKSALLCPAYLTELLQASHTSLFVTGDSMREPGSFSSSPLDSTCCLLFLSWESDKVEAGDWGFRASFLEVK